MNNNYRGPIARPGGCGSLLRQRAVLENQFEISARANRNQRLLVRSKLDRCRQGRGHRWTVLLVLLVFPAIMVGAPQDPAAYQQVQTQEKPKTRPATNRQR